MATGSTATARLRWGLAVLLLAVLGGLAWNGGADTASSELRPAKDFESIADKAERSAALFAEAGKVLQHARCVNCHPAGDVPAQGDVRQVHEPPVQRGAGGHGVVGMRCSTCHFDANFDPAGVPGAPHWHLAPASMAWQDKTLAEICEQIKDPARNGDRKLKDIVRHMADDALVAWAWEPGTGRESAPGTQQAFSDLIRAWAATGAACPQE